MRGERASGKINLQHVFQRVSGATPGVKGAFISTVNPSCWNFHVLYMTSKRETIQDWVVREWGGFQWVAIIFLAAVSPAKMTHFLSLEILRIDRLFRINTHIVTGTVSSIKSDNLDATLPQNCLTGGQSQNMWICPGFSMSTDYNMAH